MTVALAADARARVDRIKTGVEVVWSLIVESYQARDWEALGYATWDEMCTREFGTSRLRLPREERAETVQSLKDAGLSNRAIAAVTGDHERTVRRDLARAANAAPDPDPEPEPVIYEPSGMDEFTVNRETGEVVEEDATLTEAECEAIEEERTGRKITGLDGKQYAPTAPSKPKRPRTDVALAMGTVLARADQAAEAADRIKPEHLRNRKEEAATWHRSLSEHMQSLERLLDALMEATQ